MSSRSARALVLGLVALMAGSSCSRRADPDPSWVGVPGGMQRLGSRAGRSEEGLRWVTLPSYSITRTEITVAQYRRFLASTGSELGADEQSADHPIAGITHAEAAACAAWMGGRLPTEDEWEYAARAGVDGAPFPWGWEEPFDRARFAATNAAAVGRFAPNRWGLYDMAGNVAEWCAGEGVARGGSWADRDAQSLRVYRRAALPPGYRDDDVGFRVVRDQAPAQ